MPSTFLRWQSNKTRWRPCPWSFGRRGRSRCGGTSSSGFWLLLQFVWPQTSPYLLCVHLFVTWLLWFLGPLSGLRLSYMLFPVPRLFSCLPIQFKWLFLRKPSWDPKAGSQKVLSFLLSDWPELLLCSSNHNINYIVICTSSLLFLSRCRLVPFSSTMLGTKQTLNACFINAFESNQRDFYLFIYIENEEYVGYQSMEGWS